jgi:hypothetical protein
MLELFGRTQLTESKKTAVHHKDAKRQGGEVRLFLRLLRVLSSLMVHFFFTSASLLFMVLGGHHSSALRRCRLPGRQFSA